MVRYTRAVTLIALCFVCFSAWAADDTAKKDPALEIYYSANALYNRKLYTLAVAEYESFLKRFPKHAKAPRARLGLALGRYSSGDYAQAEPLLAKVLGEVSGDEQQELRVLRGQCLLQLERAPEAVKVLADAASRNKGKHKAAALVALTEALFRQEKWADVVTRSDELLKTDAKNPHATRVRFQGALARYRQAQYEQAAKVFEQLLAPTAKTPLAHQVAFLLAECRRQLGNLDGAAEQYNAAAADKEGPFAAEARFRLGFVRFTQGQHDAAIKEFTAYLAAHPKGELADRAGLHLGQSYLEKKDFAKAEASLKPLCSKGEVAGDAVLWLARTYSRQNKQAEAAAVIQAYLPKAGGSPLLPGLLYDLGRSLVGQGKYAEAAQSFGRVVKEFGSWGQAADALHMQALALHRQKDYANSLASCDAFLAAHKNHEAFGDVAFMRAENLTLLERHDDALRAYTGVVARDGKGKHADACHFRLGQLHHRKQDWKAALGELRPLTAKKLEGDLFKQLRFLAGDAMFNSDDWDGAIEHLGTFVAAQADAANRDVGLLKLGLAYARKGDGANAVKHLQEMVTKYANSEHRSLALVELGRLHYDAKRYAEAKTAFAQVKQDDPVTETAAQSAYYLGWIALAEGKDAEAITHFGVVIAKHPKSSVAADALLQMGAAQLKTGALADAETSLARLLKEYPSLEKADHGAFYLGVACARQEKWSLALPHFVKVAADKNSALRDRALYESAWCYKRLDKPSDAAKQYKTLLSGAPQSELLHRASFELAELDFEGGRFDETINRLNTLLPALKDKDLREQSLYRLGWAYSSKDDAPSAAKTFESLLTEFPQTKFVAPASFQAGEARMKGKENDKAREHFARAAAHKEPADVHELALLRLGETQGLTKQWPQSEQSYTALLATYPQSEWKHRALLGQGWARENQKKYPEAIKAYEQIVAAGKRDETAARSQFQIGECLFAMKKYAEAIQALIKVSVSYGYPEWTSRALVECGQALEQMGEMDRAREQYKEIVEKYPESDAATVAKKRLKEIGE